MEHAIGTRIILPDGRKAEVVEVEGKGCYPCVFFEFGCVMPLLCIGYLCTSTYRTDHKNIVYKEIKEK